MLCGLVRTPSVVLESLDRNGFERWSQNKRINSVVSETPCVSWKLCFNSRYLEEEPNGILDLTSLLVTGRVSEALADFLGSGEQMSERVRVSFLSVATTV